MLTYLLFSLMLLLYQKVLFPNYFYKEKIFCHTAQIINRDGWTWLGSHTCFFIFFIYFGCVGNAFFFVRWVGSCCEFHVPRGNASNPARFARGRMTGRWTDTQTHTARAVHPPRRPLCSARCLVFCDHHDDDGKKRDS